MNAELDAGSPARDFELIASTGQRIRLTDYNGKSPVILFFLREYN